MALPTPPPYSDPIPNNPFYSPQQYAVQGIPGLYIVGSGLSVSTSGVLTSTGGGGGGAVTGVFAGSGISVSGNTGNVTVSNTGVLSITAGSGIAVSGSTGNITISATSTATGTVTQVNTGAGLVGGPITTTGSIGLTMTGVSPGTYNNPTITVDSYGRISFASPGTPFTLLTATSPVQITTTLPQNISVQAASTAASGVVQLSDSTTSTASNTAATSLAVKTAFDAAAAAIPKSCLTAKGALVAGAGASLPVALPVGADGLVLTADSTTPEGIKWAAAGGGSTPTATPTVFGTVKGCVTATEAGFGCNAFGDGAGSSNVYLGYNAGCNAQGGTGAVFIGACAGNGPLALNWNCSILIGCNVQNQYLGTGPGIVGQRNLAIGYGNNIWLAGGDDLAIKPGAGIIDCAGSCGAAGQVLMSNGFNAICWGAATAASATPTTEGTVYACTEDGTGTVNTALGHSALASVAGGAGNVAVGICAGCAITTGVLNTVSGAATAFSLIGGSQNTFYGAGTGCALTTGNANTLVGLYAGCAYTTESSNVILGPHIGVPGENNTVTIAEGGGGIRLKFDAGGALSFDGSSYGTANQVLISNGASTQPTWASVNSALAAPNYGSFLGVATQTATGGANTGIPVLLDTTVAANNFLISNNSEVTAATGGIYNLQFSIQIESTGGGGGDVEIWLAKNGTYVANSNTRFHIQNANEAEFAALNFVESLAAGDYLQLYWATTNTSIQLQNSPSVVTVPTAGPDIPAVILTIVPVGA